MTAPPVGEPSSQPLASPREAALDVLEQHWADGGRVDFPVDPVVIAKALEADVVRADLEREVSGLLVKAPDTDRASIYLNQRDSDKRQRFTCAHELGHLVARGSDNEGRIGYVDYRDTLSGKGTDPDEVWANQFAAELLMPAVAVAQLWAKGSSVARVAKVFGVSQEALGVRLESLGLS